MHQCRSCDALFSPRLDRCPKCGAGVGRSSSTKRQFDSSAIKKTIQVGDELELLEGASRASAGEVPRTSPPGNARWERASTAVREVINEPPSAELLGLVETTGRRRPKSDDTPTPSILPLLPEEPYAPPTQDITPDTEDLRPEELAEWSAGLEQSTGAGLMSGPSEGYFLDFRSDARRAAEVRAELEARIAEVAAKTPTVAAVAQPLDTAPPTKGGAPPKPVELVFTEDAPPIVAESRRSRAPIGILAVALFIAAVAATAANPALVDHLVSQFLDAAATLDSDVSSNN